MKKKMKLHLLALASPAFVALFMSVPATGSGIQDTSSNRPISVLKSLEDEVGAGLPVAILPGKLGLIAMSADGKRKKTLVEKPVDYAVLDDCTQTLWYIQRKAGTSSVSMIDLLAKDLRPLLIIPRLQNTARIGVQCKKNSYKTAFAGSDQATAAILILDPKKPYLDAYTDTPSIKYGAAEGTAERLAKKIRASKISLQSIDSLREIAKRYRLSVEPLSRQEKHRVAGVSQKACENSGYTCGTAGLLPYGDHWVVLVEMSCGDSCYPTSQFYNPETKMFVDPDSMQKKAEPLERAIDPIGAIQAPDGISFVHDGLLYSLKDGVIFKNEGATGGAWLSGGKEVFVPFF